MDNFGLCRFDTFLCCLCGDCFTCPVYYDVIAFGDNIEDQNIPPIPDDLGYFI